MKQAAQVAVLLSQNVDYCGEMAASNPQWHSMISMSHQQQMKQVRLTCLTDIWRHGGGALSSQQCEERRARNLTDWGKKGLHTSFRDLLQGDGVPSPVVGQIRVGRRVLLLHVDS